MSHESYQALAGVTSILAFGSVTGACYIIYGAAKLRNHLRNKPSKTNPLFITEHVLWMSVCDVCQQGWLGWSWLPLTFDSDWNAGWTKTHCGITGMFAQFFLLASASWNFVIAISLLRMLNATSIQTFKNEIKYNHIFAWGISLICCIIPWFGDAYGYTQNIELQYGLAEFECWIKDPLYALCLYLPASIYVIFASILLIATYFKSRAKRIKHSSTSWRLALYTIVFVITWTFPIILRIHHIVNDSPAATFSVWAHHISIASIGIGNAVIWGTSQSLKSGGSENSKSKSHTQSTTFKNRIMAKITSKSTTQVEQPTETAITNSQMTYMDSTEAPDANIQIKSKNKGDLETHVNVQNNGQILEH